MAREHNGKKAAGLQPAERWHPTATRIMDPPASAHRRSPWVDSILRSQPFLRVVTQLFPPAAGLAVGKALLDYLPQPLTQNTARYLIAGLGALATMATLAWLSRWLSNRRPVVETIRDQAASPLLFGIQSPSVDDLFDASRRALIDGMVTAGAGEDELLGWQHFFHEAGQRGPRPTAIGTCYGLKAMLLLGGADSRFRQHDVVETLWRLQVPTGGWAARTQSTIGRPEVTAWVLSALLQAGCDERQIAAAGRRCVELLDPTMDPVGWQRTSVIATTLPLLARIEPGSAFTARLRDALLSGMIRDPEHELRCWSERLLVGGVEERMAPSVPHTARAIIALRRTDHLDHGTDRALDEAVRWLIAKGDLANQTEHIRRDVPEFRRESLVVKHFTAAWVARALMSVEKDRYESSGDLLREAIERVYLTQRDGIWEWDNKEQPIWMTYQGIATLRLRALRTSRLPR
jgi:hypothetical protein